MSLLREQIERQFNPYNVGIVEFSESSDFCGKKLYPMQRVLLKLIFLEEMEGWEEDLLDHWIAGGRPGDAISLSPGIRERRDYCREKGLDHFSEIDLVGGRRSSKGFVTGLAGAFKLHKVQQIPDPGTYYNIDLDKEIYFSCIAASLDQAKKFQFADLYSTITRCGVLVPHISKAQEESISIRTEADDVNLRRLQDLGMKVARDFSKLRVRPLAANADTLRGATSILMIFDEMAFMMPGESRSSAQECYNAAEPSLAQFGADALIFCNPPEAPMLMGDLSFKPIGEVEIGDVVTGWEVRESGKRWFTQSKVLDVMRRQSPIVAVTMESGRTFRCTPDHRWLTLSCGGNGNRGDQHVKGEWFAKPKEGRKLAHIVDPPPELDPKFHRDAAWLAGMIDAEGHISPKQAITIAQSRVHNPEICAEIERVLDRLGFEWTYDGWTYDGSEGELGQSGTYRLVGGGFVGCRQLYVNLMNWLQPVKRQGLIDKFMQMKRHTEDRIVSVEPDGFGEVVALTTETGNYVCNGFASKNCNSSPYTKIGKFFEQVEHSFRRTDDPEGYWPMRFGLVFPSWAMYDFWWRDPERRYRNAIMVSPDWPDVLDAEDTLAVLDDRSLAKREHEQLEEKANPETYKVERRGQWAEVLDAYLDPMRVDAAFSGQLPNGAPLLPNPSGGTYLFDYRMHCDPSSTTAGFGFAIGHVEEFPDQTGIFPDGKARHVVFDWVQRWNPQDFPGGTINYLAVQADLALYLDLFRPSELTFDQYNSVGLIQGLREEARKRRITARISEVTATYAVNWNRWETFKTALNLGLVHLPPGCTNPSTMFDYSEQASFELKFLQLIETATTRRVEKQNEGPIQTKDIADCICEVTNKFLASYMADFKDKNLSQPIQMGAEGGYQIGGTEPQKALAGGVGSGRFDTFYGGRGKDQPYGPHRGIDPRRRRT